MERTNQIPELIARYLTNDLNEEEQSLVVDWINASEANRHFFNQTRDAWHLASVKLTETVQVNDEWRQFKQTIDARNANVVLQEEPFNEPEHRLFAYRRLLRVGVAAALLLAIGAGGLYIYNTNRQQVVAETTPQPPVPSAPVVQREVNTSGKEKSIRLTDGSMIVLFSNSEITFEKPFIRRQIALKGKAIFKVAKDTSSPFAVTSGAIVTTALGTEFMVTAYEQESQLSVRLYDGKVVIQPVWQQNKLMNGEVYLLPGQEFLYGPRTARVRTFQTGNNLMKKEDAVDDNPSLPANTKGSWHMYNNQPLAQVFDHLAIRYGVTIVYDEKDIHQKYFAGQFKATDSIGMILQLITRANKLKYTREGNTYVVHQ